MRSTKNYKKNCNTKSRELPIEQTTVRTNTTVTLGYKKRNESNKQAKHPNYMYKKQLLLNSK